MHEGKRIANRKKWEAHIANWKKSSITQAEYCRRNNLNEKLFTYYKGRILGQSKPVKFAPVPLLPQEAVKLSRISVSPALRIIVRNHYAVEVMNNEDFHPGLLKSVLRTIEEV